MGLDLVQLELGLGKKYNLIELFHTFYTIDFMKIGGAVALW